MKNYRRNNTKSIMVGNVEIGGDNPVVVQSMTNTDTHDVKATVKQIKNLENAGCEIVRIAIPDQEAVEKIDQIKNRINIPLIADIHYDYKLAIESIEHGIDKIRINPGNIGARWKVKEVTNACKDNDVPMRIGGNTGSISEEYLKRFGGLTPEALVESVLNELDIVEGFGFDSIVISLKSSDVRTMVEANLTFSELRDYPLHLGVTEAGPPGSGEIFSSVGLGILLYQGIGDTIRVSLTGDPGLEIKTAYNILSSLHLRRRGVRIISCPTCGRMEIELEPIVRKVEEIVKNVRKPLTIAIMGCVVNGPGEAKEADIGIAGGEHRAIIFRKGKIVKKVNENELIDAFISELKEITRE